MKFKMLNENSNKYRRLRNSIFGNPEDSHIHTFAIISSENPLGWKDSDEDEFIKKYQQWSIDPKKYNAESILQMKATIDDDMRNQGEKALRIGRLSYVKVKGSYGDKENTYVIFNLALADVKALARDFGQQSFFFAKNTDVGVKIAYYCTDTACKSYDLVEISSTITDEQEAEDFFTKYGGMKFRINMQEFGDLVEPIENMGEFEESLYEQGTFMYRAHHRPKRESYQLNKKEIYKPGDVIELTEANLNRVSSGHEKDGYVVISASRGAYSQDENNRRTNLLKSYLKSKGYSYISVYGGYKELDQDMATMEKSLVVYPYDIVNNKRLPWDQFLNDIISIASCPPENTDAYNEIEEDESKFKLTADCMYLNQDSILVCSPGGKPRYISLKDGVEDSEFSSVTFNDIERPYFTALKKWSDSSMNRNNHDWGEGNPQRFTFESYIEAPPTSMGVGHARWANHDMNYHWRAN